MECADLSSSDAERLYGFYATLPAPVSEVFRPFPSLTIAVIQKHLRETENRRHISVGLIKPPTIVGHGFVMNIEENHPVFGLGIHTSVQGQGWGRRLMSAVMGRARRLGVKYMTLTVVACNTRAIELYRSFGFKIVANHTFKKPDDSFLMRYEEGSK